MNKDVKGLIKYLLIMSILFLIPLSILYFGFGALYYDDNNFLSYLNLLLAIILFLLYIMLPVIITYKAMKQHWSKYLNIFFKNKILTTLILVILIGLNFILPTLTYEWILFFVLPYYSVIYLTIMIVHIINWYKSK